MVVNANQNISNENETGEIVYEFEQFDTPNDNNACEQYQTAIDPVKYVQCDANGYQIDHVSSVACASYTPNYDANGIMQLDNASDGSQLMAATPCKCENDGLGVFFESIMRKLPSLEIAQIKSEIFSMVKKKEKEQLQKQNTFASVKSGIYYVNNNSGM